MSQPIPRPRVAIVFGGRSTEHAISCVSAGSVLASLDRERFDGVAVGITRTGRWVLAADDPAALEIRGGQLPEVDGTGHQIVLAADPTAGDLVVSEPGQVPTVLGDVDVVFPLLHGPYGEDGTIQGLLELAGVPYVGSGVLASALAMDKAMAKIVLEAHGLPVGHQVVLTRADQALGAEVLIERVEAVLGLPVFVKPARAGSSVGISRVDDWTELTPALDEAWSHDPKLVVEEGITGREIECGVLEGAPGERAQASVCAEIRVTSAHQFYDFAAKYLDESTEFDVPAHLAAPIQERIQELAVLAFEALGCEGMARVDFFLTQNGSLILNEVNTIPGFTPVSMFPRMWAASGLNYAALVDRLLTTALARPPGLR